jgi:hypothetical protein
MLKSIEHTAHGKDGVGLIPNVLQLNGYFAHRSPPLMEGCHYRPPQVAWMDEINQRARGRSRQDYSMLPQGMALDYPVAVVLLYLKLPSAPIYVRVPRVGRVVATESVLGNI